MACGIDPITWVSTYTRTGELIDQGLSLVEAYRAISMEVLPDNAHLLCSGMCHGCL